MKLGEITARFTTMVKPGGARETTKEYSFKWDTEDFLAAAGFIVVIGFAVAMMFGLTPIENWKLLLAFVSAIGAAVAAIVSARKKTARQTKTDTETPLPND